MYGPQINSSLNGANISVSIELLSPKQLLCECLDMSAELLRLIINHYTQTNNYEPAFTNQKTDFSALMNYLMEPQRLQQVLKQFISDQEKEFRTLARSWLFELRNLRNTWAHSENINYRLVNRGFDTLSLIYTSFKADQKSPLFQKIEFYRKTMLVATAKNYISQST